MNKMNRFFISFLVSCFLSSCSNGADKREEGEVLNCIRSKAKDYAGNAIDIFVVLAELEKAMELNGLLKTERKDSYLELLVKIKEGDSEFMNQIMTITANVNNAYLVTIPSNFTLILHCYEEHLNTVKTFERESLLFKQYEFLKTIIELGKIELKDFKEILNSIDQENFKNDLYRLPLVLLIYAEIEAYHLSKANSLSVK